MYLKNDFFKSLSLVFIGLFLSQMLYAQQPLSLAQAIEQGLANNYQIQLSRANYAIAENNDHWSLSGRSPIVDLTLNSNNSYTNSDNPASIVSESSIFSNAIVPGISANWVLFDGYRISFTKDQLSKQVELSNEQLRVQIQNSIQSIIQAYYGALVQREQLGVLEEVLTLSRDRIQYQELRKEYGQASTFDLVQAQDAYLNDSTTYLVQQNTFENALRNLNLTMGVNVDQNYQLTDELNPSTEIYSKEELTQKLLRDNPELKVQNVNIRLADIQTQLQLANRYPQVSLGAGGSYNINLSSGSQTFNFGGMPESTDIPNIASKSLQGFINIAASYNLFDGGAKNRRIQSARLQEVQAQLQYNSVEHTLKAQLANTYATYLNQQKLVSITSNLVANAQQNIDIAEERFRGGLINSFDYRSIQLSYINATQSRLNAILNLKNTETTLLQLTGGLIR